MKTKPITMTFKGKEIRYNVVQFESLKEAENLLKDDLMNVINLGNTLYAKLKAQGKNPFKPRKKKLIIDLRNIDETTIQNLRDLGIIR
jgi:hypothetical protein